MNRGIGQNGPTCWFYSTLNIFLLSDNGLKVFWKKLKDVYAGFNANQLAYFNANVNIPCPTGMNKLNMIYFWKFFDEYLCALGGPGRLAITAGKARNLLKNMNFETAALKEAKGLAPARAQAEIKTVLKSIGFTSAEVLYLSSNQRPTATATQNIAIWMYDTQNTKRYHWARNAPNFSPVGWELIGASMYINASGLAYAHVVACFIQDGKKMVFDSAKPHEGFYKVDWTDADALGKFVNRVYGKPKQILWSFLVYTRKEFTNKISPTCRRVYKPLSDANRERAQQIAPSAKYIFANVMAGRAVAAAPRVPPRVMAELLQQWGGRPIISKKTFNSVLNAAKNYNHGLNQVRLLENAGYRYRVNGPNYLNFKAKLLAKFPRAIPASLGTYILKKIESGNLRTKNSAMNNYEQYARAGNFTINKNSRNWKNFESAVNRALSTRKRKRLAQ
jgi:hypothetical protein